MEIVAMVAMATHAKFSFLRLANICTIIADVWWKIKNSLPLNILIAFGAIGILSGLWKIAAESRSLEAEVRVTGAKLDALRVKKSQLSTRLAELETPEAIERQAKEKLNLKMKGETVVVVVPERQSDQATSTPLTLWEKIKSFFGNMSGRGAPETGHR